MHTHSVGFNPKGSGNHHSDIHLDKIARRYAARLGGLNLVAMKLETRFQAQFVVG
jgi:hypothetical protein